MGCFCCLKPPVVEIDEASKKTKKASHEGNNLENLVDNISFKSDSYKHRIAAKDILKIGGNGANEARVFTFGELSAATESFNAENLLGEGGFGPVYKGHLDDTNQDIAVKQLDKNGLQGNREFLVEVLMLSLLHHPHLVNLIGYCADGSQRMLVYEYMPNGSLEDHLLGEVSEIDPSQNLELEDSVYFIDHWIVSINRS